MRKIIKNSNNSGIGVLEQTDAIIGRREAAGSGARSEYIFDGQLQCMAQASKSR